MKKRLGILAVFSAIALILFFGELRSPASAPSSPQYKVVGVQFGFPAEEYQKILNQNANAGGQWSLVTTFPGVNNQTMFVFTNVQPH